LSTGRVLGGGRDVVSDEVVAAAHARPPLHGDPPRRLQLVDDLAGGRGGERLAGPSAAVVVQRPCDLRLGEGDLLGLGVGDECVRAQLARGV
jgi:hypothetical protein